MKYKFILFPIVIIICQIKTLAQDTIKTQITYDLTTEAAIGTGDYTAYQLATNRYHVLGTRSNTAYMRGAVNVKHDLGREWEVSGAVDAIFSVHADHKTYLQQCYANLSYKKIFLEVGAREQHQVVRDDNLSIGSFVKGTNAKPFYQIHLGTNGFANVPFTNKWIQIDFDGGYGKYLDSDYRTDAFQNGYLANGQNVNGLYSTGIYMHQKHLYIRTNPEKLLFFMAGIEHAVQFGGTCYSYD